MVDSGVTIDVGAVVSTQSRPGAPLLLMLHGFDQDESMMAGLADQLTSRLATVALRGPYPTPARRWSWTPLERSAAVRAPGVAAAVDALLGWVDHHVDGDIPLAVLGFSQGGMIVTELMRRRPARFAAGVCLAGFVAPGARPGDAELAGLRPPFFSGRGLDDWTVGAGTTAASRAWWAEHTTLTSRDYPGLGHEVSSDVLDDVNSFLTRHLLVASGERHSQL